MRFSLRLNNDLTIPEYVEFAQLAEEFGFDQFWVSNDLFLRSAVVILMSDELMLQADGPRVDPGCLQIPLIGDCRWRNEYACHGSEFIETDVVRRARQEQSHYLVCR